MSNTFSLTEDTDAASIRSITFSNPPVNAMSPGLPGLVMKALEKAVDEGCRAVLLIPGGSGGSGWGRYHHAGQSLARR